MLEGTTEAVTKQGEKKKSQIMIYDPTQKSKDRATQPPHRTGDEYLCSGKIINYCSTSNIHRVTFGNEA